MGQLRRLPRGVGTRAGDRAGTPLRTRAPWHLCPSWDNGQLGGHIIEVRRLPFFGYCTDSQQLSYPLMTTRSSNKNVNRPEDEGTITGKIARTGGTLPLLPFIRPDNGKKEGTAK